MKKTCLIFPLLLLLTAVRLVAAPVVVSGHVTSSADGSPISNWVVFVDTQDSISMNVAFTDDQGFYTLTVDVPAGATDVTVQTFDGCDPTILSQQATISNGAATADFEVCDHIQPPSDCWTGFWYQPTGNGLSMDFFGEAYSYLDSNAVFTLNWDFGDGASGAGANVSHTYVAPGYYTVTLTASSGDCTVTYTETVFVQQYYSGPVDSVYVSGYVTNEDNGAPIPNWFVFANGVNPSAPAFAFTNQNGFYSMTVEVPDSAASVQVQTFDFCTNIPVVENAVIQNDSAQADFQICADSFPLFPSCDVYITYTQVDSFTYEFEAQTFTLDSNDVVVSYLWDFGDGTIDSTANPTHTYAADGVYTITLAIETASGCQAHGCDIICTYGGGIIDTFYYGCQAMFGVIWSDSTFNDPTLPPSADPLTLTFIDLSYGAVQSWEWSFGDGDSSNVQNPTHTYAESGLYTVTLHIETIDGCESDMEMLVYAGNQSPWQEFDCQAIFIPLPDSTGQGFYFLDLSLSPNPIQSWSWNFGDGVTSTEQNPYHVYSQPGVYTVTLSITADSCNSVISFDVDTNNPFHQFRGDGGVLGLAGGTTKTTEAPVISSIKAFPNPVSTDLTLAFQSGMAGEFELRISDLSGRTILTKIQSSNTGTNIVSVPVGNLTPGFYMAQLRHADQVQTVKFAKQ